MKNSETDLKFTTLSKELPHEETCLACKMGVPFAVVATITDVDGTNPRAMSMPYSLYLRIISTLQSRVDEDFDVTLYRTDDPKKGKEFSFTKQRYPQFEVSK